MAKTWIFTVQAILFGTLGSFALILGPLFLFGLINKADGTPSTEGGVALTIMSIPFLLVFALAAFNLWARRRPVLRLHRQGIEIVEIGSSSLDEIPLVPGLVRLGWSILSTQGFRQHVVRIPWESFRRARVSGLPMARLLTIDVSGVVVTYGNPPRTGFLATEQVVLPEVMFRVPLDQIAAAIESTAIASRHSGHQASW